MDRTQGPEWTWYLFGGMGAMIVSAALSGCRFGNEASTVVTQKSKLPTYYFAADKANVTYCVILDGHANADCADSPLDTAPGWTAQLIEGVLGIQTAGAGSTEAALFNPLSDSNMGLSTVFDARTGAIAAQTQFDSDAFWWNDGSCESQFTLQQDGQSTTAGAPSSVSGIKVSGRMDLMFVGITDYLGSGCGSAFTAVKNCYDNASLCGESTAQGNQELHEGAQALFAPYVNAGALDPADIADVVALGYEVSYR